MATSKSESCKNVVWIEDGKARSLGSRDKRFVGEDVAGEAGGISGAG